MTCENCAYFHQNENYPKHLGWCNFDLPSWLYEAVNINRYDVSKTVRADDSCSFFEEAK